MKNILHLKLKSFLARANLEEEDVVYILITIGKLIEMAGEKEDYETLVFYRNWVAHPELDRQSSFVKKLGDRFRDMDKRVHIVTTGVFGFVSFIEVEREIMKFVHQQVEQNFFLSKETKDSLRGSLIKAVANTPVHIKLEGASIKITCNDIGSFLIEGPGTAKGEIEVLR